MRAFALIVSALLLAAGCGQRGPLYLRDNPPPGVKAHKSESYEPVPYPAEDAERTSEKK
ncbi:MAG: lipoprotein [Betaproteobacteria bacterium]|nr:lipoprotein [Betaproteobacteria bacterium]MDH5220384.1 lipoprotein [Betaproteobacteria bacterium]MDH5349934.1 lipoprotein [Betaproteobacteria bacterium]